MNDIKRCSKCKNECLKLNFDKNIPRKDGLRIYCKPCTNQNHNNREEQRNIYEKRREKLISISNYLITLEIKLVKYSNLKMVKN